MIRRILGLALTTFATVLILFAIQAILDPYSGYPGSILHTAQLMFSPIMFLWGTYLTIQDQR